MNAGIDANANPSAATRKAVGSCTVIGVAPRFPENPRYFAQDNFLNILLIPNDNPPMSKLLTVDMEVNVISSHMVPAREGVSNEGMFTSPYRLNVELAFSQKIKYVDDLPAQRVHVTYFDDIVRSLTIVLPCAVCGESMAGLVRRGKIMVTPYIEDIYAVMMDIRTISQSITFFVNADPVT